ncbi:head maturation protease, ClpP-related [Paracoccus sp. (in: a-proteobacteria)]|uniref:head maturation protease, ClpP-related n=1 Tax=Paracoccus sp. TaxID=267 RepID=UPI0028B1501F|nr:head maturation protease, ClpP-related [Paracoccus sp. (in: a-proteobacteria)]
MSLRDLPNVQFDRPQAYQGDPQSTALERWKPLSAEASDATISIYDVIGEDWWTGEGVTAKRIAGALRAIGKSPVAVSINSPGGDMFEGLAIYNLLREHPAEVTVRVMGMAASAASIIAMAGDRLEMGLGSFLMIHNSWGGVIGNQHDMREAAETFAEFDAAMADIYAARTGLKAGDVAKLMNDETWMRAEKAMELGFADGAFEDPEYDDAPAQKAARAKLHATLAKAGVPRVERRRLLKDAAGTQNAAGTATLNAGFDDAAVRRLIETIKA